MKGIAFAAQEEEGVLSLHQLYVLPAEQGKGIGSLLLQRVLDRFPTTQRVILDVEAANRQALSFYRGRGFVVLGVKPDDELAGTLRMELIR